MYSRNGFHQTAYHSYPRETLQNASLLRALCKTSQTRKKSTAMYFQRKTTFPFTTQQLACVYSSFIWIWSATLFFMWFFHVGSGSLLQKNCTIWTISKGYALRINPSLHLLQYSQIVQPLWTETKNLTSNVMAKPTFALLSCLFLFLIHYTLSFIICELSYKVKK